MTSAIFMAGPNPVVATEYFIREKFLEEPEGIAAAAAEFVDRGRVLQPILEDLMPGGDEEVVLELRIGGDDQPLLPAQKFIAAKVLRLAGDRAGARRQGFIEVLGPSPEPGGIVLFGVPDDLLAL